MTDQSAPDRRPQFSPSAPRIAAPIAPVIIMLLVIWAVTGAGYFWPMWPAAALATVTAVIAANTLRATLAVIACFLIAIWAMSGFGYFWPVWPLLGLLVAYGVSRAVRGDREQVLEERVDELSRTRRGALDSQATELRRIERDLHDGAQARLVALSMKLGRAEERFRHTEHGEEVSALFKEAREDASAAIRELRELARGIAPPVLTDRGLEAAVASLADRHGSEVTVTATLTRRPVPAVEIAAYFVVAEALTNTAKHAPGATAEVRIDESGGDLFIEVTDFGPGGARADGGGLTGLRQRVEALDGTLSVTSPDGVGTQIEAMLPCGVVIVEDHALLREGMVALLTENGIEVVAQAEDGPGLQRIVDGHRPDLAICDVRLPPSFTDEGIRAALEARRRHPELAILVLSQYVEPAYSAELLQDGEGGVGYLLKERISEVATFVEAVRRVAAGGTALDREVVGALMGRRSDHDAVQSAVQTLTGRERETLELIAQGRTNAAIARELVVTPGAVEKHISNIFTKLDLPATDGDHRRVLAVLEFLRATGG